MSALRLPLQNEKEEPIKVQDKESQAMRIWVIGS
jgi:hypothetical protein